MNRDENGLTPLQAAFVRAYLSDPQKNAAAAYKKAGYQFKNDASARAAASELLTFLNIKNAIAKAQVACQERTQVTQDAVARELALIAFQRAGDVYRPDGSLKAPHEWDDAVS